MRQSHQQRGSHRFLPELFYRMFCFLPPHLFRAREKRYAPLQSLEEGQPRVLLGFVLTRQGNVLALPTQYLLSKPAFQRARLPASAPSQPLCLWPGTSWMQQIDMLEWTVLFQAVDWRSPAVSAPLPVESIPDVL